jgi:serine/threonine protein phosphatase PrpC
MEYVTWPNGSRLACSQALGDSGKTGCSPDNHVIDIEKGSSYKIFVGSDGFWDMIIKDDPMDIARFAKMSGEEAIGFVKSRWLQVWEMKPIGHTEFIPNQQFRTKDCDDICIVCIDIST